MKRNLTIILAGAALLALAGCSREPLAEEPGTQVLSAEIEDDAATRTTFDGTTGKFDWEANDEIALLITNGTGYRTQVDKVTPTTIDRTGTFVYSKETGWTRTAYAVYPASVYPLATARNYSGTLTLTLPNSYSASASTPLPMVADNSQGETSNLAFKVACGLLRIECTGLTASAADKTFTVTMNKGITGDFAVTFATEGEQTVPVISAAAAAAGNNAVSFTVDKNATSATLNLPLPCGDYSGITVSDGSVTKSVPAVFTVTRRHGKRMQVKFGE